MTTEVIRAALRGPNATWFKIGIGVLPLVFGMGVAWATLGGEVGSLKSNQAKADTIAQETRKEVEVLRIEQGKADERFKAIMEALKDIKDELKENRKQLKGKKQ